MAEGHGTHPTDLAHEWVESPRITARPPGYAGQPVYGEEAARGSRTAVASQTRLVAASAADRAKTGEYPA